ncbi:NCS2 family permease [Taurinivorans muris]|uniref:NCS2 family permease n=1 Tax=Taurinivorans muris TaxID=2787751 RepID=UPI002FEE054B
MDINAYFKIKEKGSTIRTEVLAGITTFMTMAYILAVNPSILSAAGMDASSVFAATALSSAIATAIMALYANLPVGLAPGMGLNAFFAFSVCLGMGYSWQFALTAVFLEGLIFILLTITNLREAILNCIPFDLKKAISAGIGLFIAFIGLQGSGIVIDNPATLVSMGNITSPNAIVTIIGLFAVSVMLIYKICGALLYGILFATVIGAFLGVTKLDTLSASSFLTLPSFAPTFWQFDFSQVFTTDMLFVLTTFLFVDLFDTVGTLVGVATKGNLLDKDGRLPEAKQAFLADAMGTCIGAVLGTSAVTSYVESASGVAAGGRTGLTALVIAVFFFISLLLAPIFLLIPSAATAPALIVVGLFMISPIKEIDFDNFSVSIPVFITIIGMPLTYSIAHGIAWGVISYVIINISMGKFKEIHPLTYILALLFIAKFIIE